MNRSGFDGYILCGTPRSGSTLLCGLLSDTGVAGRPDSFYHLPSLPEWAADWGIPDDGSLTATEFNRLYLAGAIGAGRGDTGLFGMRLMGHSLRDFSDRLNMVYPGLPDDAARFERAFGRVLFIHLTRADTVAQAVSWIKAEQTGLWHVAPDGTEVERTAPHRQPVYDAGRIGQRVAALKDEQTLWTAWFKRNRIDPLPISYEALSRDPLDVLRRLLDALGLDRRAAAGIKPGVARLTDATSLDWIARYRAERPEPAQG